MLNNILQQLLSDLQWLTKVLATYKPLKMTSQPPLQPEVPQTPPVAIKPAPAPFNPDALLPWTTKDNRHHNVRAIADSEGLTSAQKNAFSQTIHCESNYDNTIVMYNCERGFVRSTNYAEPIHGAILSKDVGICQINTHYHIGPGKDFPSEDYVLQNPEHVVHWSARQFKSNPDTWVCHSKGYYLNYLA